MSSTNHGAVAQSGVGSDASKRRFLYRMTFVLCGGMFLDGYILGIIGTVIGTITTDLDISTFWQGLIASAALIGIFVGSPLGGWMSDKYGRKPLFMADISLFLLASIAQFFVTTPEQLFVVRLLMGVAIGAEYSVGWPLMSEFSPARLRGRLLALSELLWYVGFAVAYLAGYLLTEMTDVSWRVILGSSAVIALVLLLARIGLPESPRWLWNQGRVDEAHAVAYRYLEDPRDITDIEHEDTRKGSFGMLFSSQYWRATVFTSVFWVCAVTPYFAIATFAASVLETYGLDDPLAGGVGLTLLAAAGVVVSVLLIDRVGRRPLIIGPQWVCAVALAVIGLWSGAPAAVVLTLFLIFSFVNAGYTALTGVYPSEVFPTEIRGIGTGFACSVSRIGAAVGTFLMPWSIDNLGAGVTMLIAAGITAIGAAVSQALAPETKGLNLSETAHGVMKAPALQH